MNVLMIKGVALDSYFISDTPEINTSVSYWTDS